MFGNNLEKDSKNIKKNIIHEIKDIDQEEHLIDEAIIQLRKLEKKMSLISSLNINSEGNREKISNQMGIVSGSILLVEKRYFKNSSSNQAMLRMKQNVWNKLSIDTEKEEVKDFDKFKKSINNLRENDIHDLYSIKKTLDSTEEIDKKYLQAHEKIINQ